MTQPPADTEELHRTDLGNAGRFVQQHGSKLRYVPERKTWLVWDRTRWRIDDTNELARLARKTVRAMYREASEIEGQTARTNLAKWALTSESKARIDAMVALATSEEGIPVLLDSLDQHTYLLNCRNGTIDLRTGQLLHHQRDHLLTQRLEMEYNPAADCPQWLRFLARIFADDGEMICFVQRAMGYTLTGSTQQQCLFFAYGTGRNGKSTFFEVFMRLLGEYAQKAPTSLIMQKHNDGIPNDVARLAGARLVVTAEVEEGRRLSESLVKDLTGGDTISARFLHQEWFDFTPTHKLWIYGNHKPEIRGTDPGIWRRIRVLPFDVQIPADEVDPQLKNKLLAELPGILAWAVRGCLDWQQHGLNEPAAVRAATQAYRTEMDTLAAFMSDCCVVRPGIVVKAGELYKAYTTWCEDNGERPISQRRLGQKLDERGFERRRTFANGWIRLGLGLLSTSSNEPDDPNDPMIQDSGFLLHESDQLKNLETPNLGSLDHLKEASEVAPPGQGNTAASTAPNGAEAHQARIPGTGAHLGDKPLVITYWLEEYRKNSPAMERLPAICKERGWDYEDILEYLRQCAQTLDDLERR